jgi:hypothetical protein
MTRETVVVNETLQELRASGFEMAKGEPDIRGWKVVNSQDQVIGKVKELLFDVKSRKVRYLIIDLDGKPINLLSRDVIIPVGLAELGEKENVVYLPDVTVGHLATLPEYKRGKITYHTERQIRDVFIPRDHVAGEKLADIEAKENPEREAFYNNEYYDENRMYKRRKMREKINEDIDERRDDSGRYIRSKETADGDVVYIQDDKDPSVLRRARVVKEPTDNRD